MNIAFKDDWVEILDDFGIVVEKQDGSEFRSYSLTTDAGDFALVVAKTPLVKTSSPIGSIIEAARSYCYKDGIDENPNNPLQMSVQMSLAHGQQECELRSIRPDGSEYLDIVRRHGERMWHLTGRITRDTNVDVERLVRWAKTSIKFNEFVEEENAKPHSAVHPTPIQLISLAVPKSGRDSLKFKTWVETVLEQEVDIFYLTSENLLHGFEPLAKYCFVLEKQIMTSFENRDSSFEIEIQEHLGNTVRSFSVPAEKFCDIFHNLYSANLSFDELMLSNQ